jgi:hypothetical protein
MPKNVSADSSSIISSGKPTYICRLSLLHTTVALTAVLFRVLKFRQKKVPYRLG